MYPYTLTAGRQNAGKAQLFNRSNNRFSAMFSHGKALFQQFQCISNTFSLKHLCKFIL